MASKKWAWLLVCIIVPAFATSAAAIDVDKGVFLFGPQVGGSLPFGDFGDAADPGFAFGGTGDYMITQNVGLGADIIYNFFGVPDEYAEAQGGSGVDFDWKLLQFGGHGKYFFNPESNTKGFVQGGIGFYNVKLSGSFKGISASASSTELGISGGGGALFKAGDAINLTVTAMVHNVMTEGSSSQYLSVLVGALFGAGGS